VSTQPPSGDPVDRLVAQEGEGLFRFLVWSLGSRDDALDALQEVMIRVHRGHKDLREPGSERRWLYRIATNVGRDFRSRRRRIPKTLGESPQDDVRPALAGEAEPSPLAQLEAKETSERLRLALADLPEELREPLLLFAVTGLKYREIAESLGWPIGTVTTRIHEARKRIADKLG
jgi:RNA polymerase sigma-70 factor (ECF subfamily)